MGREAHIIRDVEAGRVRRGARRAWRWAGPAGAAAVLLAALLGGTGGVAAAAPGAATGAAVAPQVLSNWGTARVYQRPDNTVLVKSISYGTCDSVTRITTDVASAENWPLRGCLGIMSGDGGSMVMCPGLFTIPAGLRHNPTITIRTGPPTTCGVLTPAGG